MGTSKQDETAQEPPKARHPHAGIVGTRKVIAKPMSRADQVKRAGGEVSAEDPEYANAPKPIPKNDYKPVLKQMRAKHKRAGEKPKPFYMSDLKL